MDFAPLIWLDEPIVPDDTFANRAEETLAWLTRSTTARAKGCRRFLNEHIAKMPLGSQANIKRDLGNRFQSAFFELIVARLLQEWGASVAIEEINSDGKRPDFTASFPDGRVTVEAKSPVFNSDAGEELKNRIPLLNFVESNTPEGWVVCVWQLPQIGGSDSQKDFKRVVRQMLDIAPPCSNSQELELIEELDSGLINLQLFASDKKSKRLAVEAPITTWSDSESRIRYSVQSKKKQVRKSEFPVLLAIQADFMTDPEDFDIALFGRSFERLDRNHRIAEIGFIPSGEFAKDTHRAEPPVYAGVLAFFNVSFASCSPPIFYRNPRFTGVLPTSILQLEQRAYDMAENKIVIQPLQRLNVTNGLNLVDL